MNRRGLVIARHRREVVIETGEGDAVNGLVLGRKLGPLTGDEVHWRRQADGTVVVEEILRRRSLLKRIDSRGRGEGVAANLSLIAVVVAPLPAPDWQLVDRYLVAAESMSIAAVIVRNKRDIADAGLDRRGRIYAAIGYEVIPTSANAGSGMVALAKRLRGERSVLVGQSGVGKSSLMNALPGTAAQAVGALSERRALGRHTTTAAMLHRLPDGGELIDSPGVRRYAPHLDDPAGLAAGFVEFRPFLDGCRFNDCRHSGEPGCAVTAALQHGDISAERYASYLALRATLEKLPRG